MTFLGIDPQSWIAAGATAVGVGYGIVQRFKSLGKEQADTEVEDLKKLVAAKDALIAVGDEWKERYNIEHDEYKGYREEHHKQANEYNVRILEFSKENADLKAKTDLTPLFQNQATIVQTSALILESIQNSQKENVKITAILDSLSSHIMSFRPRSPRARTRKQDKHTLISPSKNKKEKHKPAIET